MRTVDIDGVAWVRHAERRCARCGARTYRVSRRVGPELLLRPMPGRRGSHTFTRSAGPKRLLTVCTGCLHDHFRGAEDAVQAWAAQQLDRDKAP